MTDERQIKYLTKKDEDEFLQSVTHVMYKFIALIMFDCGLRVTECITLKMKDFNWQKRTIYVRTLKQNHKKRKKVGEVNEVETIEVKKEVWRTVYMTDRIIEAAANHFKDKRFKIKDNNPDQFVFPCRSSKNKSEHISRLYVWKYFKMKSDRRVNPHMLRHTCATKMVENNVDIITIRDVLGHKNLQNTNVYLHATEERKKRAAIQVQGESKYKRWFKKNLPMLFKRKAIHTLPVTIGWTKYHIGRKNELRELRELAEKKVNVILLAEQGMGKTHLLDNYTGEKIIRIDDTKDFKKSLCNIILVLCQGDKDEVARLLDIRQDVINKMSVKNLVSVLKQLTLKDEYTIIIDSVENVTPSVIVQLEEMRNHFHFIVAARKMKVEAATWLTNFTQIRLKALSHAESTELIVRASEDFRQQIEDFQSYKNHIIMKANGNPQFILEIIDRFRKEDYVTIEAVSNYEHVGSLKEIDMSYVFIFALSSLMILRYLSGELGHDESAFKLFGGAALIFALFARQIVKMTRKRYV